MDPFTTNGLEAITRGRWQWRSNSDPWSKAEEPQWEPYSLEHNYLIEKAYYEQRKEVDLGNFLVYPLEMLQTKKGTPEAQRPIRRIDWVEYEEMNDRSSRYFETELPKTLNKIFGSLEDFISFFGRRNAEISRFRKEFCSFEESKDLDVLKNKIIPPLISCLENELLSSILQQLQDPSLSTLEKRALLKKKERHENLTLLFQKDFSSVEEFYGNILKSYTMNSSLYANLNKYLRNESWVKIDNLLPYIFCLCKAFFNIKPNTQEQNFLLLYRGTALDEAALMTYSMKKSEPYFSWFSVTSTSRNVKIAQEFMFRSVNIKEKKTPVMFIIEVPISEEQVNWIDIKQYSVISKEDEVILAPGSVFELVEILSDQDGLITTIKLKLKGEVQSLAHGGMMMQGALQSQLMTEKEAKIMCLEGEELSQALMSLHGNQLIEELEFCLCTFDKKLQEEMFEILPMLQRIKILRFIACTSSEGGNGEITNQGEQSKIIKIQVIEANNFFQMICNEKRSQTYWNSLRELELDFGSRRNLKDKELDGQVSQGLKYLPQLTSLKINFEGCYEITDDGMKSLAHSLNSLTQLVHLYIRFFICMNITDLSAKYLSKGLSSLTRLARLDMKFESCRKITDVAADNLAKGFNSLTQLTCLNIKFRQCGQMTGNAVNTFASQALKFLSKLNSLNLDFDCVENSTFLPQELRSLTQLTSLTLENLYYDEKELTSFVSDGLKSLLQLTSLTISFWRSSRYKHITDETLSIFAAQGLKPLLSLTALDLSFYYYGQITDKGVSILASQGLKYLGQLKSLALVFYSCDQITEEGVSSLMSQGIQNLTQLEWLTLNFPFCDHVTEKGMKTLAAKWLRNLRIFESLTVEGKQLKTIDIQTQQQSKSSSRMKLTRGSPQKYKQSENDNVEMASNSPKSIKQSKDLIDKLIDPQSTLIEIFPEIHQLTSLNFSFEMNSKIVTDEFVQNLAAQVLSHCPQLTCLTLNFNYCDQITDKGILDLGLRHLSQLRSLHLRFFECNKITAEGWMNLASNGLRHLSQLESLVLRPCTEISDEGVRDLAIHGLKPLANLASLNLDFSHCQKITDQGMMNLANEGLRHLSQLKSLTLEFVYCEKFTHEGWVNLAWNGLRHLPQLESLVFKSCQEITDKGVESLVSQGFKYLTQLKSLSLDFSVSEITDKGVNILILQVVKNLPQLTSLDLDFHDARNISDFTIQNVIRVLHYFGFTKKNEEADENSEI